MLSEASPQACLTWRTLSTEPWTPGGPDLWARGPRAEQLWKPWETWLPEGWASSAQGHPSPGRAAVSAERLPASCRPCCQQRRPGLSLSTQQKGPSQPAARLVPARLLLQLPPSWGCLCPDLYLCSCRFFSSSPTKGRGPAGGRTQASVGQGLQP